MKRRNKILLIILTTAIIAFDIWWFFKLTNKLIVTQGQLSVAQSELALSQDELKVARKQLREAKTELEKTQEELAAVNHKLAGAEKNNLALLEEKNRLTLKLHSLNELKEAIRQLKREYDQERVQQYLARKKLQRESDELELAKGNRGFLLKEGQSQHRSKVKIEMYPIKSTVK